jgi:hypothetical protein
VVQAVVKLEILQRHQALLEQEQLVREITEVLVVQVMLAVEAAAHLLLAVLRLVQQRELAALVQQTV